MRKEDENGLKYNKHYIGYFMASFLLIFLLSFIVLFIIEKKVGNVQFDELKANEVRLVALENDLLGEEFSMVLADLHYLSHAFEEKLDSSENHDEIAANWKEFSARRNIYDQIRFIDALGNEKIRINSSKGGSYIVPAKDLQNKKKRYYFYEAADLPEESIHVSPLDLNIEQGRIEEPYKPIIRFSTPIYDDHDKLKGIIVLNYLAENVIERFRNLALNSRGEMVLLNSKGYWLSSTDKGLEWGFLFEDQKTNTFSSKYPKEWEAIRSGEGQGITSNGLFTFSPVNLHHKITSKTKEHDQSIHLEDGKWYIVSSVLREGAHKFLFIDNTLNMIIAVLEKNSLYFLLVLVISTIVAFLLYLNRKTYARIKYYSEFDPLTKVYNRRAGINRLNELFPADDGKNFVISLCFIDVNGLKQVNDTLGHKQGDELIITVVDGIKSDIREYDFVMRLGGDEFLIVFNGIETADAEKIWGRIIENYGHINDHERRPYLISVSHGIVSYSSSQKSQVDDLIKMADEKMYEEKRVIKENLKVIRSVEY